MKKALIYPFNYNFLTILNHANKLLDLEIHSLVSPLGWGFCNEEYSICDKKVKVTDDFNASIEETSLAWFIDSPEELDLEKFIIPKVKYAIKNGKQIIYTRKDFSKIATKLSNDELKNIVNLDIGNINDKEASSLSQISTPVIFICGIYEGLDTFNVNLSIGEEFQKLGYSTLQISPKKEAYLFGLEPFPRYMFDDSLSSKSRILNFNNFIKVKEVEKKPDVIIVEIPGELFHFSNKIISNFGMHAYEISNSIQNDCGILCMPSDMFIPESCEELKYIIKGRFGINIDYFNVEKKVIDVYGTDLKESVRYLAIADKEAMAEVVNTQNSFCIEEGHAPDLISYIVNQLKEYSKVISI